MKKTIGILLVTVLAFLTPQMETKAQTGNLDTVSVNLTAKASEWAYYASYWNGSNDSTDIVFMRNLRTTVRAVVNPTWNTNITVNGVKGKYILAMYNIGNRIPAGEALLLGVSVLNTIKAIPNATLQYYIGTIDAGHERGFESHRTVGKNLLID